MCVRQLPTDYEDDIFIFIIRIFKFNLTHLSYFFTCFIDLPRNIIFSVEMLTIY